MSTANTETIKDLISDHNSDSDDSEAAHELLVENNSNLISHSAPMTPGDGTDANAKKRKFIRSSFVWEFFEWSYTREGFVVCKCGAEYNLSKTSSTSTLLGHINHRCEANPNRTERAPHQDDLNFSFENGENGNGSSTKLLKKRKVQSNHLLNLDGSAADLNTSVQSTGMSFPQSPAAVLSSSMTPAISALAESSSENIKELLTALLSDVNALLDVKIVPILNRIHKLENNINRLNSSVALLAKK